MSREIKLSQLIAPAFLNLHSEIKKEPRTHYWIKGGRGSAKSSFVSVELILLMMQDMEKELLTSAVVLRRFSNTIRDSALAQLTWALDALGVGDMWSVSVVPPKLTLKATGQSILFRGLDDPTKLKSLKAEVGYLKYCWFEEASEIEGMEKVRSVLQSVNRGGESFLNFYTFNPPREKSHWINREMDLAVLREDTRVLHCDYLSVPRHWLGEQFFIEAEHLKEQTPLAYAHEYLGQVVGFGDEVFSNVVLEEITQQEIARFDKIFCGLDWGYATDPLAFNCCYFDKTRKQLFIYKELHLIKASNQQVASKILETKILGRVVCDSAEPKSIDEIKSYGINAVGAKKGPDSVSYGIKWLASLEKIVIDPSRCPYTADEFSNYSLQKGKDGSYQEGFPDKNNHHIDAVRYALESQMIRRGVKI